MKVGLGRLALMKSMGLVFAFFWMACLENQGSRQDETASSHRNLLKLLEPFPRGLGELELERWYAINVQDETAGSMHLTIKRHATPRGWRRVVLTDEQVVVERAEHRMEIRSTGMALESEQGELLRYRQIEQQTGGDKRVVEAGRLGEEMITLRGPEITRVKYEPGAVGAQMPYRFVLKNLSQAQERHHNFRSYSSQTASYVNNQLKLISNPEEKCGSVSAYHTIDAMPGMFMLVELDSTQVPCRMESALGALKLKFVQVDQKPQPDTSSKLPNLDPLLQIRSNVRYKDRARIKSARYKLSGLAAHVDASWLSGPGQNVVEKPNEGIFVLQVQRQAKPKKTKFPQTLNPDEQVLLKRYLSSSELAPIDNPKIQKLTKELIRGAPDGWSAVRRLRKWVSENIESHMGMAFASALEVLRKKKGDCTEQSVLLATLARAAGIPARCVMGLVYQDGMFARHMWTEVWLGGDWQAVDAAMQTDRISAAWIRLGEHSLQLTNDKRSGLGGMLVFVSDLKIEVMEHQYE